MPRRVFVFGKCARQPGFGWSSAFKSAPSHIRRDGLITSKTPRSTRGAGGTRAGSRAIAIVVAACGAAFGGFGRGVGERGQCIVVRRSWRGGGGSGDEGARARARAISADAPRMAGGSGADSRARARSGAGCRRGGGAAEALRAAPLRQGCQGLLLAGLSPLVASTGCRLVRDPTSVRGRMHRMSDAFAPSIRLSGRDGARDARRVADEDGFGSHTNATNGAEPPERRCDVADARCRRLPPPHPRIPPPDSVRSARARARVDDIYRDASDYPGRDGIGRSSGRGRGRFRVAP